MIAKFSLTTQPPDPLKHYDFKGQPYGSLENNNHWTLRRSEKTEDLELSQNAHSPYLLAYKIINRSQQKIANLFHNICLKKGLRMNFTFFSKIHEMFTKSYCS